MRKKPDFNIKIICVRAQIIKIWAKNLVHTMRQVCANVQKKKKNKSFIKQLPVCILNRRRKTGSAAAAADNLF